MFTPSWPPSAALTAEITKQGSLARVWRSLAEPTRRARPSELTARTELAPIELARCLGRCWRKEQRDFWQTLSPLGIPATSPAPEPNVAVIGPSQIERMREQLLAEARRDAQTATDGAAAAADWTSYGIDGLMLDPDEEPGSEEWR